MVGDNARRQKQVQSTTKMRYANMIMIANTLIYFSKIVFSPEKIEIIET